MAQEQRLKVLVMCGTSGRDAIDTIDPGFHALIAEVCPLPCRLHAPPLTPRYEPTQDGQPSYTAPQPLRPQRRHDSVQLAHPSPGLPCRQHPIDVVGLDDLTPSLALDGILTLAHAPVTGALVDSIDRSKLKIVSN